MDGEIVADSPDWSLLPADMLIRIFSTLEVPDLVCSGAACKSWYAQYKSTRRLGLGLCSRNQGPYLLYSSAEEGEGEGEGEWGEDEDEVDVANLRRLSTNKLYNIPIQLQGRYVVGSSHGWLVAADERSELHLLNPITGTLLDLPPLTTLAPVQAMYRDREMTTLLAYAIYGITPKNPNIDFQQRVPKHKPEEVRRHLYLRAVLSAAPSPQGSRSNNCNVLLIHYPRHQISFARPGDAQWTWLNVSEHCVGYQDCFFDDKDGLFYAVRRTGQIHTIDLNGPLPVVNSIFPPFEFNFRSAKYIVRAPWGDLLQVWRQFDTDDNEEPYTFEVIVFKPDFKTEDLVQIKDLRGHALFVGFGACFFVSAKDFPLLTPNCVYLAHDNTKFSDLDKPILKEVKVYNIQDGAFVDQPTLNSAINCTHAVWVQPSCSAH